MPGEPILIVDDHPTNLKLARVLLSAEGYEVRTAEDASGVQAVLKEFHPRLILMDIQLPGQDGLSFTRELRDDPATAPIPVVALTAHAMTGDKGTAIHAGCAGYIAKPIDTRSLGAQVRKFITRHAGAMQGAV